jgi:YD repeat-containing protein
MGQGRGRGMGMMRGGFGERVAVVQDAKTLKATNTQPDGTSTTFTYNLDGSESRNTVAGRQSGEPIVLVSKASWNGDKLSIATTINVEFGGNAVTFSTTDVLTRDGETLTVQSTRSGRRGGEPVTTTTTYKKAQ